MRGFSLLTNKTLFTVTLKPITFLVDGSGNPIIIDFGISDKILDDSNGNPMADIGITNKNGRKTANYDVF